MENIKGNITTTKERGRERSLFLLGGAIPPKKKLRLRWGREGERPLS